LYFHFCSFLLLGIFNLTKIRIKADPFLTHFAIVVAGGVATLDGVVAVIAPADAVVVVVVKA